MLVTFPASKHMWQILYFAFYVYLYYLYTDILSKNVKLFVFVFLIDKKSIGNMQNTLYLSFTFFHCIVFLVTIKFKITIQIMFVIKCILI